MKKVLFLLLILLLAGCRARPAPADDAPAGATPPALLVQVGQTGLYEIKARALQAYGWDFDEAMLAGKRIRLSQGEQELPVQWLGAGKKSVIRFFAQVTPTRFDNRATLRLRLVDDAGDAAALGVLPVTPGADQPASAFVSTVRTEPNTTYLAQVREGDPWLGPRLLAPATIDLTLNTPDPVMGEAQLQVKVWAATAAPADIDHHLQFVLNGVALGDDAWDGKGPHVSILRIPTGVLQAGDNVLQVQAPGDTEAPVDLLYLDWASVTYPRAFRARDERLLFSADASQIAISGFRASPVSVWETSDPLHPRLLTPEPAESAAFSLTEPGPHTFAAVSAQGWLTPETIRLSPPPLTMPPQGADYLIIAHPSLAEALEPLIQHRQQQGLRVALVTTEQIYLKFSDGMQSPAAITDFLRWAHDDWPGPAPRFVLLAGDASYDPLGYLPDAPNKNLVPTVFVPTVMMGETASDNALADIDGDGLPDLAVGRLPAQTPADIRAMVAKILDYETNRSAGDWVKDFLFVADDDDAAFSAFNETMVQLLPGDIAVETLTLSPEHDIRPELLAALNDGRGLVSYMGHGAVDIWAREEIFSSADVPALRQQGKWPVMLVWACLNGYFQHPQRTSLGETLLLTPGRGAVAGLFPTGETFTDDQLALARALFGQSLFQRPTLGEALLDATRQLDPAVPGQRDIIHTFVLLGDPGLALPFAQGQPAQRR